MSAQTTGEGSKKQRNKLKTFFRGVWSELKKVHWPTRQQLITYTGVVIVAVAAMSFVISLFDWIVSTLVELVLRLA